MAGLSGFSFCGSPACLLRSFIVGPLAASSGRKSRRGNMAAVRIMDQESIRRAVLRMAHEILEKNKGVSDLALVGIRTRGVILAQKLKKAIKDIEGVDVPVGILDITLYRDDLTLVGTKPLVRETLIDFDITDLKIVLVDDVFYTGRTIRAGLNALVDFGRPASIQLAVLIDRGHRELPIRADFVGKNIPTTKNQDVQVILGESDGKTDEVVVAESSDKNMTGGLNI